MIFKIAKKLKVENSDVVGTDVSGTTLAAKSHIQMRLSWLFGNNTMSNCLRMSSLGLGFTVPCHSCRRASHLSSSQHGERGPAKRES